MYQPINSNIEKGLDFDNSGITSQRKSIKEAGKLNTIPAKIESIYPPLIHLRAHMKGTKNRPLCLEGGVVDPVMVHLNTQ